MSIGLKDVYIALQRYTLFVENALNQCERLLM